MSSNTSFKKFPFVQIEGMEDQIFSSWEKIFRELELKADAISSGRKVIAFDLYQGVYQDELIKKTREYFQSAEFIITDSLLLKSEMIEEMVADDLTSDPVFGRITNYSMADFFDREKLKSTQKLLEDIDNLIIIIGTGASLVYKYDILVYFDMARWEIIQRFRADKTDNLFINNKDESFEQQYKRAFFIDWRIADKHKQKLYDSINYIVDSNNESSPKMLAGNAFRKAITQAVSQPFELVPFFDPGPWGGQWMKKVCDLDKSTKNFAWCFNCVPEENSILFKFGEHLFETPAINIVFYKSRELLGNNVFSKFGAEFPIRFDFLDTFEGGNLSLQVHPTLRYIRENFNMSYTQDESYYIVDSKPGAKVYLGLKEKCNKDLMIKKLKESDKGGPGFPADEFVEKWDAKKHDHFLIPAGTVHCSGVNSLVLEISATPYIFTFKLWDWNRLGMNGKPRPIHINHGEKVIQWDRTTNWTKNNLINRITKISENEHIIEEKTGLHELEFIETRRHWFTGKVSHNTGNTVNVLNLVEGEQVIVESPSNSFNPLIVNFAETFVVPANVGEYTITPSGPSINKKCATIKAFIRE